MVKFTLPQMLISWKKNPPLVKFPIPPPLGGFSPPPPLNAIWKILISDISRGFFWNAANCTTSGYMLNADGHLMDQFPGSYRFLVF